METVEISAAEACLLGVAITSAMLVVGGIMWFIGPDANPARKIARRGGAVCVILGLSGWLWMPWAAYALRSIWRANMAAINDLERPEIVLPPSDVVRPSKAETATQELPE